MVKNKNSYKKRTLLLIFVGALAAVGLIFLQQAYINNKIADEPSETPTTDSVNLDPPTPEDSQRVEINKERIATDPGNTQTGKSVTPIITYAGQYDSSVEVGAYIDNTETELGTCTATFSLGDQTISKSVKAVRNANSVDCPVMSASTLDFKQKGSWQLVVSYKSNSAEGTSSARQVEIK